MKLIDSAHAISAGDGLPLTIANTEPLSGGTGECPVDGVVLSVASSEGVPTRVEILKMRSGDGKRIVAANIARIREARGYTQATFAILLGVSEREVVAYESGERALQVRTIIKVAEKLEITVDALLSSVDKETPLAPTSTLETSLPSGLSMELPPKVNYAILRTQGATAYVVDQMMGWRIVKGLSHRDLATRLGVNRQSVSLQESGKQFPDFSTLEKWAAQFRITVNQLLFSSLIPP